MLTHEAVRSVALGTGAIALLACSQQALCQVLPTDILIEKSIPSDVATAPRLRFTGATPTISSISPQTVRISATNASSFVARNVVLNSFGSRNLSSAQLAIDVRSPCNAVVVATTPDVGGSNRRIDWSLGDLQPGESRSCDFGLRTVPTTIDGFVEFRFRVSVDGGAAVLPLARAQAFFLTQLPTHVTDLGIRIIPSPIIAPPGTIQDFDIEITNHGPDPFPRSSLFVKSIPYQHAFTNSAVTPDPYRVGVTGDPRCRVFVIDLGATEVISRSLDVVFDPIAVGESRRCTLGAIVLPSASGRRALPFTVINYGEFAPGVPSYFPVDPNVANNVADMDLLFTVQSVPAADRSALILLGLALLLGGVAATRAHSRRRLAATIGRTLRD